jgi:hypothetical protein
MMLAIESLSPRAGKTHVIRDNECETWRSDYTARKVGVPQLLLVEQKIPGSQILPHFHDLDQFQVFMDDHGKLGNHSIMPCQRDLPPHAGVGRWSEYFIHD